MSVRVKVHKADGTVDEFGNVMSVRYSAGDEFVTVVHDDGKDQRWLKAYGSGHYKTVEVDAIAACDPAAFPTDSVLLV